MNRKIKITVGVLIILFLSYYSWTLLWNYSPEEEKTSVEIIDVRNTEKNIEIDVNLKTYTKERICSFLIHFPDEWLELQNPAHCNPPGSCVPLDIDFNSQHTFVFLKKDNPPKIIPGGKTYIELFFNGLTECKFIIDSDQVDIKDYMK